MITSPDKFSYRVESPGSIDIKSVDDWTRYLLKPLGLLDVDIRLRIAVGAWSIFVAVLAVAFSHAFLKTGSWALANTVFFIVCACVDCWLCIMWIGYAKSRGEMIFSEREFVFRIKNPFWKKNGHVNLDEVIDFFVSGIGFGLKGIVIRTSRRCIGPLFPGRPMDELVWLRSKLFEQLQARNQIPAPRAPGGDHAPTIEVVRLTSPSIWRLASGAVPVFGTIGTVVFAGGMALCLFCPKDFPLFARLLALVPGLGLLMFARQIWRALTRTSAGFLINDMGNHIECVHQDSTFSIAKADIVKIRAEGLEKYPLVLLPNIGVLTISLSDGRKCKLGYGNHLQQLAQAAALLRKALSELKKGSS